MHIYDLELTNRSYNSLIAAGITTAEQILGYTDAALLRIPGIGRTSLDDIKGMIQRHVKAATDKRYADTIVDGDIMLVRLTDLTEMVNSIQTATTQ